jgi:hypothetical protein
MQFPSQFLFKEMAFGSDSSYSSCLCTSPSVPFQFRIAETVTLSDAWQNFLGGLNKLRRNSGYQKHVLLDFEDINVTNSLYEIFIAIKNILIKCCMA